MKSLEIPLKQDRDWRYRCFEILPGASSWLIIFAPIILSFVNTTWAAYFVVLFMLAWLIKAFGFAYRTTLGYNRLKYYMRLNWTMYLDDLNHPKSAYARLREQGSAHGFNKTHGKNLTSVMAQETALQLKPRDVYHAVIIATYNEPPEVVEPTIQTVVDSLYDVEGKVMLLLAYEARAGELKARQSQEAVERFKDKFWHIEAVGHPDDIPNEVRGKGANLTFAGNHLAQIIKQKHIDPAKVLVTTLDSDNRPHPSYLAALTYNYVLHEDRQYKSYQPIPMFLNNIWDAPAPMRVLATGNSFWNLISSTRPHLMRNFAAHSQSLATLIDTDFWSVRTIVEDGHQFWRTYFRYDGKHDVVPIFIPNYQDAVLEETYTKTLKAQFIQLRRWAYGASDIAYLVNQGYLKRNKVPRVDLFFKFVRLMEAHISWATAPLILAGSAWLPILINPEGREDILAHQLPRLASNINTLIAAGIMVTVFLSMKMLPPRPPRYKAHKNIFMVLQWVLLPVSSIIYGSFAALTSQTRLMFARYLDRFDVTVKVVKK
jgi:cellulose synthase/poly-beta-1,6-N-acetylglucosamine synthase-like glycosyltransferase